MDTAEFLLASGFGLLIVLLGWSSQIASKSKETKDLEKDFLQKANLKSDEYKKIVNKGGAGTKESLFALVDFLYTNKRKDEDIEIFNKIKNIKTDLVKLDAKYTWRFWVLLGMTACLFISGLVALFLADDYKNWALVPNLVFIIAVFCNLINVHILEKRYTDNITKAMEKL